VYSFRAHPMQNGLTIKHFNTVFGYFVNLYSRTRTSRYMLIRIFRGAGCVISRGLKC